VIEIDDLHRAGEMLFGQVPDPFGSIAHDHLLFRAAPAALSGFPVDAPSKFFRLHLQDGNRSPYYLG